MVVPEPRDADDGPEELREVGIEMPDDFEDLVGYHLDTDVRYLALWWTPHGDEVMLSDGYSTFDGATFRFMAWDRKAGRQALELAAERSPDHTSEDVPDYTPRLLYLLANSGYVIGSSDEEATHALLFDSDTRRLHVGRIGHVQGFVRRFNDTPEWIERLPDDPERLAELFERAAERAEAKAEELADEYGDLFGDPDDDDGGD
jgi:hypothetical protein